MKVSAKIFEINSLTTAQRDRMFEIFGSYFDGAKRDTFNEDLDEKNWAVVLADSETNQVCGFSTLRLLEDEVDGVAIRAFFSGDTIIDRTYWACLTLEKTWLRFTYTHAMANREYRYFWFLIANSYRSFRYLPVYTKKYYPNPTSKMPDFEKKILDQLATKRYGNDYDPKMGIIRLKHSPPLLPGVADIGKQELEDPRIAFFQKCNPGWKNGDQLACLTEFSVDNMGRMVSRALEGLISPSGGTEAIDASPSPHSINIEGYVHPEFLTEVSTAFHL